MACRMVVSGSRDGEEEPGGGRRRGFQREEQAAHLHGEAEVAQLVHAETAGGEFVTSASSRPGSLQTPRNLPDDRKHQKLESG